MNGNTKSRGGLLLTVCAVLFAAVFSFALLGCDSDPGDDGPSGPTTPAEIRGTWAREYGSEHTVYIIGEKDAKKGYSSSSKDDAITRAKAGEDTRAYKGEEDGIYTFGEPFVSFNVTKVDGNLNQLKIGGDLCDKVTE
jgi:hypothetical protein